MFLELALFEGAAVAWGVWQLWQVWPRPGDKAKDDVSPSDGPPDGPTSPGSG